MVGQFRFRDPAREPQIDFLPANNELVRRASVGIKCVYAVRTRQLCKKQYMQCVFVRIVFQERVIPNRLSQLFGRSQYDWNLKSKALFNFSD